MTTFLVYWEEAPGEPAPVFPAAVAGVATLLALEGIHERPVPCWMVDDGRSSGHLSGRGPKGRDVRGRALREQFAAMVQARAEAGRAPRFVFHLFRGSGALITFRPTRLRDVPQDAVQPALESARPDEVIRVGGDPPPPSAP